MKDEIDECEREEMSQSAHLHVEAKKKQARIQA